MAEKRLNEIRDLRLEKVARLREMGIDPYPSKPKTKPVAIKKIRGLIGKRVSAAGRVMGFRVHGNIVFSDLEDFSGSIQIFFQKKKLDALFEIVKLIDIGDILWVNGDVFKTKAGEITIDVSDLQILSKSIRPLPSKWHGIKDEELRYRERYIDLLFNRELRDLLTKKSVFWNSIRGFLVKEGFIEVETPVLESTPGGADAKAFVTHHDALDIDLYLRISMGELWQKRLMVAGFEKTFEIGRQFRNEGISHEHLQDYTQMEFYWAYANYEDSMKLVERMYKYVAKATFGKLKFKIGDYYVDLGKKWERVDYKDTLFEATGIDFEKSDLGSIKKKLDELKIKYNDDDKKPRLIDLLWKSVRKEIAGPLFLTGHPVEISPLAKRKADNPNITERYQVILAGTEMGNGYSELNDPVDQAERFEDQQKMRDAGDEEAQMNDADFVKALEFGMPPVSGFGVSERLFSFLADKPIRETVFFPLLRPKE